MDQQKNNAKITAIVPAYNEGCRIGSVLKILTTSPLLDEVIVVDDGSTDDTEQVATQFPVRFLKMPQNGGKGAAMERGVQASKNDILFFCDADIRGLRHALIEEVVRPVVAGDVDVLIAMRNRKTYVLRFLLAFIPLLGGERALTKRLWYQVPSYYKEKFRIEAALNFYAKYYGKGFRFKVFPGLGQTIKEKKYGLSAGLRARCAMMFNYLEAQAKLEWVHIPKTVFNRRLFVLQVLSNIFFFVIGMGMVAAVYFGPRRFLLKIFSHELATDPGAPFVHFLLRGVGLISVDVLLFFGALICMINLVLFIASIPKLTKLLYTYREKFKRVNDVVGEKKEIL